MWMSRIDLTARPSSSAICWEAQYVRESTVCHERDVFDLPAYGIHIFEACPESDKRRILSSGR